MVAGTPVAPGAGAINDPGWSATGAGIHVVEGVVLAEPELQATSKNIAIAMRPKCFNFTRNTGLIEAPFATEISRLRRRRRRSKVREPSYNSTRHFD